MVDTVKNHFKLTTWNRLSLSGVNNIKSNGNVQRLNVNQPKPKMRKEDKSKDRSMKQWLKIRCSNERHLSFKPNSKRELNNSSFSDESLSIWDEIDCGVKYLNRIAATKSNQIRPSKTTHYGVGEKGKFQKKKKDYARRTSKKAPRNPLFKKKGESKFYRAKEKAVCEEKRQTIYHFLAPPNRQSKKQKIPSDKTVPIDINKQSHHHQETQMKSPTAKVDKTKMIEDIEQLISEIQSQTPKPVTTGKCVQMPGTGSAAETLRQSEKSSNSFSTNKSYSTSVSKVTSTTFDSSLMSSSLTSEDESSSYSSESDSTESLSNSITSNPEPLIVMPANSIEGLMEVPNSNIANTIKVINGAISACCPSNDN